ncbi:MAG: HAD family phosphatase [Anaerolineae bacterium]|nr:HAD family phosphatase [Anaerolineae bacterium]
MMSYEAILFDMDGVIIDTHHAVTEFWQILADEQQIRLTEADFQQHIYGCSLNHTFDTLFPQLNAPQRQVILDRMEVYELSLTYTAIPGAVTLLRALKQAGVPTALVTSAFPWKVDLVMHQLELADLFKTLVTAADIQRGKPHPDGYLLGAQRLQLPPQRCLVFEDAVSGVQAAVTAGAGCVGVRPPETAAALVAAGAFHTIPDFTAVTLQAGPNNGRPAAVYLQDGTGLSLPLRVSPAPDLARV